jgi:hypothetical protein
LVGLGLKPYQVMAAMDANILKDSAGVMRCRECNQVFWGAVQRDQAVSDQRRHVVCGAPGLGEPIDRRLVFLSKNGRECVAVYRINALQPFAAQYHRCAMGRGAD